jgi:cholesterol oxidase
MTRSTCRLCGECDLGCNYGSKNTLDYNYLTAAARHHADIRTLCEVKTIRALERGYEVSYVVHNPEAGKRRSAAQAVTITCEHLILAAGAYGSPYLLLKHRANFPQLSLALGTRVSINGDLLSFLVGAKSRVDGKLVPRPLNSSFGPVITSGIRYGDTLDGKGTVGRGFYVEDGGNPYVFSWLSEISGIGGYLRRLIHLARINLKYRLRLRQDTDLSAEIAALLGDCIASRTSLPVLSMGRDHASGKLEINGKHLECDWKIKESQPYYDRLESELRKIAEVLHAKYMENPAFQWNFHQVLTAHPLGGCPMGQRVQDGVVDSYGEVFGHPGLYVVDGSIMPGPVGPNPSLTIAAIASRAAENIIEQHKGKKP